MVIKLILAALAGYLIGSVPWALVIGKVFYNTDVREHGSHNLGATNAGRVLGKKVFFAVAALDALKGLIVYLILNHFDHNMALAGAVGTILGHCYPLFSNFKGGKGVATSGGIVIGLALGSGLQYFLLQLVLPLAVLVIIVLTTKYMSLASISAYITAVVVAWLFNPNLADKLTLTFLCIFVIYKHRENIVRLLKHQENKTSFSKK